jgi:hypothetical protein
MRLVFLRDPHSGRLKYVRRVKGNKYQARPWVGGRRVNLGLFDSEWEAACAVVRYVRLNEVPPGKLPKFVRRERWRGGRLVFVAHVVLGPGVVERRGPFPSAADAERAVLRLLADLIGPGAEGGGDRCLEGVPRRQWGGWMMAQRSETASA